MVSVRPQVQRAIEHLGRHLGRAPWLRWPVALLVGSAVVALHISDDVAERRRHTSEFLQHSAFQLEKRLRSAVDVTDALAAAAALAQPRFERESFDAYARRSAHLLSEIEALQWSPQGVLRFQYPRSDGPQIGLNLLTNPRNRALSTLALRSRRTVLQGPFRLVQGGHGLVLRRASFATGDGHFLGFSGVLLDWDAQTRELDREARFEGMQLAFAVKDSSGGVFRSPDWAEVQRQDPRRQRFALLDGEVELAAVRPFVWHEQLGTNLLLFVIAGGGALLATSWLRLWLRSRALVHAALKDQNQLFDALFTQRLNPVLLFDGHGALLRLNPAAQQLEASFAPEAAPQPAEALDQDQRPWQSRRRLQPFWGKDPQQELAQCLTAGTLETEWVLYVPGTLDPQVWQVNLSRVDLGTGPVVIGSMVEITETRTAQLRLERLAAKYQGLFEQSLDAILLMTPQAHFLEANPACAVLYGVKDVATVLTLTPADFSPALQPDGTPTLERAQAVIAEAMRTGLCEFEWLHRRCDTGELWLGQVSLLRVELEEGSLLLVRARDISESRRYEERLRRLADKYQALFEQSLDAVTLMDSEARMLEANEAAARLHGLPGVAAYLAITPLELSPERQPDGTPTAKRAQEVIEQAMREGGCEFEWLYRRCDTGALWLGQVSLRRVELEEGPLLLVRVRDISESRRYEEQLRTLAYQDELTGLPNRLATLAWLEERLAETPHLPFSLINADLDGFQQVNDSFGSAVGDQVLRATAECLRNVSGSGAWVARLESDAFVVVLPYAEPARVINTAEAAQQWLSSVMAAREDVPVRITLSMGMTRVEPQQAWTPVELMQQANTALAQARRRGNGHAAWYDPAISQAIERRLALEQQLDQALQAEEMPFSLVYQPKVRHDGSLAGAEALIRWQLPDGSAVAPAEFIPLAERSGHIHALGNWVIHAACRQLARWRALELPLPLVAINISAVQFESHPEWPLVFDQLQAALQVQQLQPHHLQLEITETAFLGPDPVVIQQLEQLEAAGFRLAIDDFGTGFASMQTLKRYPVHVIKVDKGFVDTICTNAHDQAIVESTLVLARRMGLESVAEGVEHPQQWELLKAMGCDLGQGYLFSRPLAPEAFADLYLRPGVPAP